VTVPATALAPARVNVEVVIVAGFIASLNLVVTVVLGQAPFAGVTENYGWRSHGGA
jgi:hypothetical protein